MRGDVGVIAESQRGQIDDTDPAALLPEDSPMQQEPKDARNELKKVSVACSKQLTEPMQAHLL